MAITFDHRHPTNPVVHIPRTSRLAGANLRELMERMGHSSTRAALIYLHSSADRQRTLADALGDIARAELSKPKRKNANPSGT